MRVSGLVTSGLLGLLLAAAAMPVAAQSPSVAPSPSALPVPVVGPDARGAAPSPPIGPQWDVVLEWPIDVLRVSVVACEDGFATLAFGRDGRAGGRAFVRTSPDGRTWSRAKAIEPDEDHDRRWIVDGMVAFRGALFAVGGDARALAVWRSVDCGASWRRLRDPAFTLGPTAVGINGLQVAATGDRLLVVGDQGGEDVPSRRWAWLMERGGEWRRIPGGLDGTVDSGLTSDGRRFWATRQIESSLVPGATALVVSGDGETWAELAPLPDVTAPVAAPELGRLLVVIPRVGPGQVTHELLASADGTAWSPFAASAPADPSSGSRVISEDGALVWLLDTGFDDVSRDWTWIGVSEDGGHTWSVSAGWPGLALAGMRSVAADARTILLATTGPRFDAVTIRALAR